LALRLHEPKPTMSAMVETPGHRSLTVGSGTGTKGCVGAAFSPGTSETGTGRSSIG